MSTVRIKHWGRKQGFMPLGTCSHPNCKREADEIGDNGKVYCTRHLVVRLTAVGQVNAIRPGQGIGR
jgi:hypothetical protein